MICLSYAIKAKGFAVQDLSFYWILWPSEGVRSKAAPQARGRVDGARRGRTSAQLEFPGVCLRRSEDQSRVEGCGYPPVVALGDIVDVTCLKFGEFKSIQTASVYSASIANMHTEDSCLWQSYVHAAKTIPVLSFTAEVTEHRS